jgi:hypothetical protein
LVSSSFFIKARRINTTRASETELSLAQLHALLDVGAGGGGGGSALDVHEEGVSVDAAVNTIDFIGAAITATSPGAGLIDVTVNAEAGATADQTDAEIETAYNNQVAQVSQAEAEAGTVTADRRWTPQRVSQAIAALGAAGGVASPNMMVVRDEKADTTGGGNSSATTVHTRTLNTVAFNNIDGASLASNQITLPAGTYYVEGMAPTFKTSGTRAIWYNVTDAANEIVGQNVASNSGDNTTYPAVVSGVFTITAEKDFELRHYTNSAATNGLGTAVSDSTVEVYSQVTIWEVDLGKSYLVQNNLLHVQDQKAANTDGGGFTAGAWQTRVLNTSLTNEIDGASLASNQITLPPGTYYIEALAPAYSVTQHKAKLYDTTGAADLLIGTSNHASTSPAMNFSVVEGRFTLTVESVLELRHRCTLTKGTNGFGTKSNYSVVEVYSDVRIWQIEDQVAEVVTGTLQVRDEKTANTNGGGLTTATWNTRTLNTVVTNTIAGASLATNQITLPAGTYEIDASAPGYLVNRHKAKLRDTTGAADLVIGSSAFSSNAGTAKDQTDTLVKGRFSLTVESVLELQHNCGVTNGTNGAGLESNLGVVEVYADVTIRQLSI